MALQPRGSWQMPNGMQPPKEPMFNLPMIVKVLGGIMLVVHLLQEFVLSASQKQDLFLWFSFLPSRYSEIGQSFAFPGGILGDVWTFVTYAFLHGSWMHLLVNMVWLAAFGTVVARRIGAQNFVGFFVVTAAAGAALHLLLHSGSNAPLVGVSAVLSGTLAAAARFVFTGGFYGISSLQATHRGRCMTLSEMRYNRQVVMFLGIWLALNLVFGLLGGGSIAWEAHLGGFVAGLLVFPYLDPWSRPPKTPKPPKKDPPKKRPEHLRIIK